MNRSHLKLSICLLTVVMLSACAQLPLLEEMENLITGSTPELSPEVIPAPRDALVNFVSNATAGETSVVEDSESGTTVQITVGRLYHAASGSQCRKYKKQPIGDNTTVSPGIVCRNPLGQWYRARVLANPGS